MPQVHQDNIGNDNGRSGDEVDCAAVHKRQQRHPVFDHKYVKGKKPVHLAQALKKMEVDSSAASRTRTAQKIAYVSIQRDSCDSIASSNESNLKMNIINVHNIPTPYVANQAIATHDYSCQIAETKMPGIRTHLQKIETEYDCAARSNSNRSPTKTHETTQDAN